MARRELLISFSFAVVLVFCLWRDGSQGQQTLNSAQKSKWQNNTLSLFVAALAFGLAIQSVMGLYSAAQIEIAYDEDTSLQRLGDSSCFVMMAVNFQVTLLTFCGFLFCTLWLLFFNQGPAAWFQNHYFIQTNQKANKKPVASKSGMKTIIQATHTFTEEHMTAVLVALGIFCAFITLILFVSIQLNKKLLRRMDRVNTVIQVQSFTLALVGLCLFVLVERSINFDGVNASSVIIN